MRYNFSCDFRTAWMHFFFFLGVPVRKKLQKACSAMQYLLDQKEIQLRCVLSGAPAAAIATYLREIFFMARHWKL